MALTYIPERADYPVVTELHKAVAMIASMIRQYEAATGKRVGVRQMVMLDDGFTLQVQFAEIPSEAGAGAPAVSGC